MNGHIDDSPPKYGQRLPLRIIEERAQKEPDREWLSIPRSSEPADGWQKITYRQASRAIDRCEHLIVEAAGRGVPGEFPTIAYLGLNDSRYLAFMFGAVKAGYKALFVSPRNSVEGQLRLFQATDCHVVASSAEFEPAVRSWAQQRAMKIFVLPEEKELLLDESVDVPHTPYEKDFAQAQWEPLVVLHTSGSSGFPKPIVLRNGLMAVADGFRSLPTKYGTLPWVAEMAKRANRLLVPMPFFHISGLFVSCFFSTFYEHVSLGIGSRPISTDLMYQCIKHSGVDAVFLPPSIVDDMSSVPEYLEAFKELKFVAWGGGSLTPQGGARLVENKVQLCNLTSSTEAGPSPFYFQANTALWQYFIFDNPFGGNEFRKLDGDEEIYRHVYVRQNKEPGLQGIFWTFEDQDEFDTQDLYRPHPELPDHWIYYGRADSIIVFSNGEKLNPTSMEAHILSHPQIKGTLVVGTNRLEPALIIEPVNSPQDEAEEHALIQSVWPLIQEANRDTVAHGRIQQDMIMLAHPDKPLPRAGKGTIQRPMAVALYQDEIDRLYETVAHRQEGDAPELDISSEDSLLKSTEQLFTARFDLPKLSPETDFFTAGMDSLQVITACRLLSAGLKAAGADLEGFLPPRVIYSNPNYSRLAAYLFKLVQSTEPNADGDAAAQEQEMRDMVEKYTQNLPPAETIRSKPEPRSEGQTVLLTGSTGALGSYLLHSLVSNPSVSKVICLNRSADGRQRQAAACSERGLTTDFAKCEFLRADLSLPGLGLEEHVYARIVADGIDRVIHNAWPVNFNIALSSFEPHVRGVRHLVDLSARSPRRAPVVFISSISTVDAWTHVKDGLVPEVPIPECGLAAMGYGQSKHVSSLILDEAARVSGVPTSSIRVGQIAGPRAAAGAWNRQEWLPTIVASSLYLGVLPRDLGRLSTVDWVPIEDVAGLVLDITLQGTTESIDGYFHCGNPSLTTWDKLADAVKEAYAARIAKLVTFEEWVSMLRESAAGTKDANKNPGVKLLDMYEAQQKATEDKVKQVLLDMERTKRHSETARGLQAITPELMKNWCRQWGF